MKKLLNLQDLTYDESKALFSLLKQFKVEQQSAVLALLQAKKECKDEILGALDYFSEHAQKIDHSFEIVDIVGTGGDRAGTFNISTAASILMASCGVLVAKHGGKSASSQSGSQDVVETLGIKTPQSAKESVDYLKTHGYVYLWAPLFNSALKAFGSIRKNLSFPTIFNILGPLLNPMKPKKQLIGVYRKDLCHIVCHVLINQGVERALIVHSEEGLDEISISHATHILEINHGAVKEYKIQPEDFGFSRAKLADIKGGDAHQNAQIIHGILLNQIKGPKREVVLLNAGAGLYISGKASGIEEGINIADQAIISGQARQKLYHLQGVI